MAKSKFAFNAMAALMIFVVMASFAGTAFAIDVAPTVSLSASSTSVTTSVTLTAIAVDVLDNAGIQWIKIYENGGLLDTKSCGGTSSCTFVKVVTKASSGIFSYYAQTQDNSGKTATSGTTVVTFNTPPVLSAIGNQIADENALLQFTISATDPGDTLTYSASGLPAGASFNPATQTFSWTPDYTQSGAYPGVIFTVTDSYGSTDSEAITITVNNVNRNPDITSTPVTTGTENVAYSYDVDATDPDLDALTYSLSIFPMGMTIDSVSGLISWTPDYTQAGDNDVSVCVTDVPGAVTCQGWTISVANVNRAPTWVVVPVNQMVNEDTQLSYDVDAIDPDIEDTVLYSVNDTDFSIDANGLLTWMPIANWNGVRYIQLTASDGSLSVTADITVTVNGINDAPIITSTPVTIADEDALYEYFVVADDYDFLYGDGVVFSLVTAPSGMVINWCGGGGPVTCRIQWTPNNSQVGLNNVEVLVNDSTNTTVSQPFTINVANTNDAPVFSGTIPNQNFAEDGSIIGAFDLDTYFTDDDVTLGWGDFLTYSVSGNSSVLVTINGDGTVDFSAVPNWNGVETLTFTATDSDLASASSNPFTVTVIPQSDPPVWDQMPTDQIILEDSSLSYDVNASDPDIGDTVSYYVNDTAFSIDANGLLTWTPAANWNGVRPIQLTASDGSTNITADITITVTAVNDAPMWTPISDQPVSEDFGNQIVVADLNTLASDVDGDSLTFSIAAENTSEVDCAVIGNQLEINSVLNWFGSSSCTVRADDGNGGTADDTFTITVSAVNDAPYPIVAIPDVSFDEDSYNDSLDMVNYFADIDSVLSYSYSSNESDVNVNFVGTIANITASANWFGTAILSFTASDGEYNVTDNVVITIVNPVPDYAVSVVSSSYYQEVGLLQPFVYTITVSNTGDTADSYTLTVQNIDSADQAQLNESVTSVLNSTQTYVITLTMSDSNPDVYSATITATGNANAVTSTIVTNVTTTDAGWVYSSTINGTLYTSQSTGIWNNINDSFIQGGSIVKASAGGDFAVDILIIDSQIDATIVENSWLTSVNATNSAINNSILTNCVVVNATVKNIVASNCYLADGTYDPPGGGNNLTGSDITNSYTYQSNVTYSNVTYSNITYSNINNSVIDNSDISYSTVYDSTVRDSTLSWATVINGALITGSQLINSTADNSTVTNSVLTRSNVTDSTIIDSILTDTSVMSSTLTNVTATNSAISGTTIANVVLVDANLTNGVLYNGTITMPDNRTYNATDGIPFNLSNPSWPSVSLGFAPSSVDTNTAVTFTATTSGQFDASTTMTYEWDFDNNGIIDQTSVNSTTAMKTYNLDASYVAKVTVRDGHGNSASNTIGLTVAYAPAPSGGGGTSWHEPTDKATYYLRDLLPGIKYTIAINLEDIALTSIDFTVNESISSGQITIRRMFNGTPSGLENAYQYVDVTSTFSNVMEDIEISYKVNNSWFAIDSFDKTNTKLAHYVNGAWKYLSTTLIGEDDEYTMYKSISSSFSIFSITSLKSPQVMQPPVEKEPPAVEGNATTEEIVPTIDQNIHPAFIAIIAVAIVIIIVAIVVVKFDSMKKRKFWRDGGEPLTIENTNTSPSASNFTISSEKRLDSTTIPEQLE